MPSLSNIFDENIVQMFKLGMDAGAILLISLLLSIAILIFIAIAYGIYSTLLYIISIIREMIRRGQTYIWLRRTYNQLQKNYLKNGGVPYKVSFKDYTRNKYPTFREAYRNYCLLHRKYP